SLSDLIFLLRKRRLPRSTLFPYTTLFRSKEEQRPGREERARGGADTPDTVREVDELRARFGEDVRRWPAGAREQLRDLLMRTPRSEEHTSELQSLAYLVCRLLLEKKKKKS